MPLTVRQILTLQSFRRAEPEVVSGEAQLDCPVRWVHSSEIYEIGPLLKGGELLLTSGLGLAQRSDEELRAYVQELAERRVSAIALEVAGRTFANVPASMIQAGRRYGLPIITLHAVVPFIEIIEEAHLLLIDRLASDARLGEEVSRIFTEELIAGSSLARLAHMTSHLLESPLLIATIAGRVVASGGIADSHQPEELLANAQRRFPIRLHGQPWGDIHVLSSSPGNHTETLVLERAATAFTLALLRTSDVIGALERPRRELFEDMLNDKLLSPNELVFRCGLLGFHPSPSDYLTGLAIGLEDLPNPQSVVENCFRRIGVSALSAAIANDVLAIASFAKGASPQQLGEHLLAALDTASARAPHEVRPVATLGPTAHDLREAARSVREARTSLRIVRQLALPRRLVRSDSLFLDRLITQVDDRTELAALVAELLGPLIDHDKTRGSKLLVTLDAYLKAGGNKAEAARSLFVRRQSLYARLARIEELGVALEDPECRAALLVALKAFGSLGSPPARTPS